MPITQEDVKGIHGATPQEEKLIRAGLTLQQYTNVRKQLGGYATSAISSIYGGPEEWNPTGAVEAILKYSELIDGLIDKRGDIIKTDPLLGETFADYLAEKSKSVITLVNMALPWLEHVANAIVNDKVQAEKTKELATLDAEMKKKAEEEQVPKIEELMDKLHDMLAVG